MKQKQVILYSLVTFGLAWGVLSLIVMIDKAPVLSLTSQLIPMFIFFVFGTNCITLETGRVKEVPLQLERRQKNEEWRNNFVKLAVALAYLMFLEQDVKVIIFRLVSLPPERWHIPLGIIICVTATVALPFLAGRYLRKLRPRIAEKFEYP